MFNCESLPPPTPGLELKSGLLQTQMPWVGAFFTNKFGNQWIITNCQTWFSVAQSRDMDVRQEGNPETYHTPWKSESADQEEVSNYPHPGRTGKERHLLLATSANPIWLSDDRHFNERLDYMDLRVKENQGGKHQGNIKKQRLRQ